MSDISLTAGIRANLLSLQGTSDLLSQTQSRLGSGKKVASAVDNATAYFTAQSLSTRASDLTARLDGIAKGINVVKAANTGVTAMTTLLNQAKGAAQDARALSTNSDGNTGRSAAAVRFNTLLTQITSTAKDAGFDGVNLLNSNSLTVEFAQKAGSSTLSLTGFSGATGGSVVTVGTQTAANWQGGTGNAAIDSAIKLIETSVANLQDKAKEMSANLAILTSRQTFTKNLADTLTTGADSLTNADLNLEAANLLALNTRQQMGVNALSLASQASQSVLKLLG
jgi:flagellin-like hook-associated protein FlgL